MPDDLVTTTTALSLQFAFDGLSISLVDAQLVELGYPMPSEPTGPLSGEPGFWYELRDLFAAVLWRQSAVHPMWFESEGPGGPNDEMAWATDAAPAGAFVAQVPVIVGAVTLALVGSPPPGTAPGPVQDLAVIGIGDVI